MEGESANMPVVEMEATDPAAGVGDPGLAQKCTAVTRVGRMCLMVLEMGGWVMVC